MTESKNDALTHSGKFHADDVFSSALLKIINPNIKIIRAFDVPKDFDGIVFDIGCGKFDHLKRVLPYERTAYHLRHLACYGVS